MTDTEIQEYEATIAGLKGRINGYRAVIQDLQNNIAKKDCKIPSEIDIMAMIRDCGFCDYQDGGMSESLLKHNIAKAIISLLQERKG
jgi:hypothetical protein